MKGTEICFLDIYDHLFMDVRIADNVAKFFERYLAVLVLVGEQDRFVDDLLQLGVFQVITNHHFQYLKCFYFINFIYFFAKSFFLPGRVLHWK